MKLRQVTEEVKQKYLNEVTATVQDYDAMIKAIDAKLVPYGAAHFQQTKGVLSLNYAKEKKDALKVEIKNINTSALDSIISKLKGIKERYIKEVAPATATTDPLELSFIEKELKVMTESEFREFYEVNYLDTNIVRLCNIENKARHGYKDGKTVMPLPEYGVEDGITKRIDKEVKTAVAMRSTVETMCVFAGAIDETGSVVPKMLPWNTVFEQVEKRNMKSLVRVSLIDFIK